MSYGRTLLKRVREKSERRLTPIRFKLLLFEKLVGFISDGPNPAYVYMFSFSRGVKLFLKESTGVALQRDFLGCQVFVVLSFYWF